MTALMIACFAVAAGALAYLGKDLVAAIARRRTTREPRPEPVSPTTPTPGARHLRLPLVRRLVEHRAAGEGPAPTVDDQPDETDAPPAEPAPERETSGADDRYATDLRKARDLRPSPDLIRPAEQMVADHADLAAIGEAIDLFDATIEAALDRFLRDMPAARMHLAASVEQTGEISRAELDEMLMEGASA
jgi:hypothetical protein